MIDISKLTELEILTLTLIGEARGESIEGQVAVANVIRNRVLTRGKSYGFICLESKQFSCWNNNDPNRLLLDELGGRFLLGNKLEIPSYNQCLCVARGILKNEILDNTRGALNYLSISLFESPNRPSWAHNIKTAVTRGTQIFFTA